MSFMFNGQWAGPVPRRGTPGARARSNGVGVPVDAKHLASMREGTVESLCDADLRHLSADLRNIARRTYVK